MKRLFAAVKITPSPNYIQVFNEISSALRHERIKWVEPGNMHLTLKFFGETEENRIPDIQKALTAASLNISPFIFLIADTGIFGSRYDPKVIWFGITKHPELDILAKNIFTELEKYGWQSDRQNFVPHLTIGRIKELNDKLLFQQILSQYRTMQVQEQTVKEIVLYESILRREGPEYIRLHTFPMQGK